MESAEPQTLTLRTMIPGLMIMNYINSYVEHYD